MNSRDTLLLMQALLVIMVRLDIRSDTKLLMELAHRVGALTETIQAEKI